MKTDNRRIAALARKAKTDTAVVLAVVVVWELMAVLALVEASVMAVVYK